MRYAFAPMEGLTNRLFRAVHYRLYPETDVYYTPFLSPTAQHAFAPRDFREILAGEGEGVPTVPQLLTKSAEDFLWAARELAQRGYSEVNLNLGCPSGTVFAKGKGSGLLADLPALERLLDDIFARSPLPVSLKTRLGVEDPAEFERLLALYNRYPVRELIIHVRTRREQYAGAPHPEAFAAAWTRTALPLCYNGDIRSAAACRALEGRYPGLSGVMLGRALVANPALIREAKGGAPLTAPELRRYHDALYAAYCQAYGAHNAVLRMKEVWACMKHSLRGSERIAGKIARARDSAAYEFWAHTAFAELPLLTREE